MMIRQMLVNGVVLATLSASASALAGDAALAESLFREGRKLMETGNYRSACPKLSESFTQDPATGTLLALALCQEQVGQTASAWANFAAVMSRAKREGRPDREQAAQEHAQALESKLSRLTVEVDPRSAAIAGLVVKRDGVVVGNGAWGAAAPVDPGAHVVEASAPGKRSWQENVTVRGAADAKVVQVPLLEDDPSATHETPSSAGRTPSAISAIERGGAGQGGVRVRTVGIAMASVGVVGLGISGYFALHAKSLNAESKSKGCDANDECEPAGYEFRNSAISAAKGATVALIAGGVLTAAGVTLVIVGGPTQPKTGGVRIEATPLFGRGVAAILARGSF